VGIRFLGKSGAIQYTRKALERQADMRFTNSQSSGTISAAKDCGLSRPILASFLSAVMFSAPLVPPALCRVSQSGKLP
jgi:hypothetical protein